MILENKTAKILGFDHPQKLHPSKICTYMVYKMPKFMKVIISQVSSLLEKVHENK